jgi:ribosomal protein L11 methyltransferase
LPYRIDIARPPADGFDRLVSLGALDVEADAASLAAIVPDGVSPDAIAGALGVSEIAVSPAIGRDDGSVWVLAPRPVGVGRLVIAPEGAQAADGALRLIESPAFGTGLHPTTALCLETLQELIDSERPEHVLDIGTGSGVLALAALLLGVPRAVGVDIDTDALDVAARNARLNGVGDRLQLVRGGPEAVDGTWRVVLANVLAAALIEMAPVLVRRLGHHGRLVLSGIPSSVGPEVEQVYRRLGLRTIARHTRAGWDALVQVASW